MRTALKRLTNMPRASRRAGAALMTLALPVYAPLDILPVLARKPVVKAGSRRIVGA